MTHGYRPYANVERFLKSEITQKNHGNKFSYVLHSSAPHVMYYLFTKMRLMTFVINWGKNIRIWTFYLFPVAITKTILDEIKSKIK